MKTKIINIIKTIIALIVVLGAICLYNSHKNTQRLEYAEKNNCTWTIYGSHDICK